MKTELIRYLLENDYKLTHFYDFHQRRTPWWKPFYFTAKTHTIMDWSSIVGTAAAVCMILGYMPQAITTIRTRDTDGIAIPTFLMMGLGSLFFVIQGILLSNWPLAITNIITFVCSAIVFGIKMYNDYFKKR